jgi:hypothetical protein
VQALAVDEVQLDVAGQAGRIAPAATVSHMACGCGGRRSGRSGLCAAAASLVTPAQRTGRAEPTSIDCDLH